MRVLCLTPIDNIEGVRSKLEACGELFYHPDADGAEAKDLIDRYEPDAIFVNPNKMTYRLDDSVMGSSIRYIATASTGTNHIDLEYCRDNDIEVISLTTDLETIERITSTAEHAFALTMSIIRNVSLSMESVRQGEWDCEPFIGRQLNALRIGIIGYGRLGKMYAKYCQAFDADVVVCDPYVDDCPFERIDIEEIFRTSDIIAIHVHLNEETRNMINKDLLGLIGDSGCYLINTSRGGIVDEHDVIGALIDGNLLGYATDVLVSELSDQIDSPILKNMDDLNIVVTPHIGGMSKEGREIAYNRVADRLLGKL